MKKKIILSLVTLFCGTTLIFAQGAVQQDKKDIRHDQRDINHDRQERNKDLREGKGHAAVKEQRDINHDKREKHQDVKQLHRDEKK